MLFSVIVNIYRDNHKRIINRLYGQNAQICDVKQEERYVVSLKRLKVVICAKRQNVVPGKYI
jgi:hypothetical protein